MSSLEQQVGMYAVNSLWEVAVVGGAGWLVSRLLKNFGPRAQHAVWVVTLLVGVVTPAIPMLRAAVSTMLSRPVAGHALVSFAVVGAAASRRVRDGIGVPEAVMLGIFVLFMVLAAYFALRLCQRVGRVARLRRRAVPVQLTEVMNREWARCREAFGSQGTELLRADGLAGPVTAGFWQPVVIVPDGFVDGGGEGEFVAAMAHECAHIRRRDYGKNLLYEVASVVIAYHPVAWFVKARIAQTREMICDEMASEKVLDAYSYAASLLRLAERLSGAGQFAASQAMGIFDADVLERRIMSMKQKKLKVSAGVRGAVTGAGAAVVLCMAAASAAMAGTIHVQTTKSSAGVGGENLRLYAGATCTYYDSHTKAHAGTCATRPENAAEYYCAENGTAKFEPQMGCKGKVERTRGAEAAEQFADKVYAIGKGVTAPVLLYAPEPKFTTQARLAKYQGVVVLQMVVTRQGRTEDIHVVRHLGMGLDRKAVEAAKLYRFKPAQYEGHPVAVKVKMEALFHLF